MDDAEDVLEWAERVLKYDRCEDESLVEALVAEVKALRGALGLSVPVEEPEEEVEIAGRGPLRFSTAVREALIDAIEFDRRVFDVAGDVLTVRDGKGLRLVTMSWFGGTVPADMTERTGGVVTHVYLDQGDGKGPG